MWWKEAKKKKEITKILIDRIKNNKQDKATKILRLWAISQLRYHQRVGDLATSAIEEISGPEFVQALFFVTGFLGQIGVCGPVTREKLLEIAMLGE